MDTKLNYGSTVGDNIPSYWGQIMTNQSNIVGPSYQPPLDHVNSQKDPKHRKKIMGDLEDKLTHVYVEHGDNSIGRVIEFLVISMCFFFIIKYNF